MHVNRFTLAHEELVSDTFAIPGGRFIEAKLELLPSVAAGNSPQVPDTLTLVVESRKSGAPDSDFVEIARTRTLSEPGFTTVAVPTPEKPHEFGEVPDVARVRIVHTGRLMPRFHADLIGL